MQKPKVAKTFTHLVRDSGRLHFLRVRFGGFVESSVESAVDSADSHFACEILRFACEILQNCVIWLIEVGWGEKDSTFCESKK